MNIEILKQIGNEWQKAGKHRIYFNGLGELYGIETERYNSGNICGATLNDEAISNSEAKRLLSRLMDCKIYFDVVDSKFHFVTNTGDTTAMDMCRVCITAIKAKVAEMEAVANV